MQIYGHGGPGSRARSALLLGALVLLTSCEVEWGGATLGFVNPAPAPEPAEAAELEETVVPLPAGELLYLVRLAGEDGAAEAVPVARIVDGAPVSLGLPESLDEGYRVRFDSAFYAAETELPLHAGGHRIGTLILGGEVERRDPRCLSLVRGRALLLPDTDPPEFAFAWAGEGAAGSPVTYDLSETDSRMRTFGPVLAETLLREGGENRPYLARRTAMRAVPWPGDERPAMAATYMVNDDLVGEPPQNPASSLFFLARFDGRRYVPEWWEVRRYEGGTGREAYAYFGAIAGPEGRVDFATRIDGTAPRLVGSVDREGEERRVDWTESEACPAVALLSPDTPEANRAAAPGE